MPPLLRQVHRPEAVNALAQPGLHRLDALGDAQGVLLRHDPPSATSPPLVMHEADLIVGLNLRGGEDFGLVLPERDIAQGIVHHSVLPSLDVNILHLRALPVVRRNHPIVVTL